MSYKNIDKLLNEHSVSLSTLKSKRILSKGEKAYEVCLVGKMKKRFSKSMKSRYSRRVRRLYVDLLDIRLKSMRDYKYFLVIVDDVSKRC